MLARSWGTVVWSSPTGRASIASSRRYVDATREVLRRHSGLWFYDESYVISRRRE